MRGEGNFPRYYHTRAPRRHLLEIARQAVLESHGRCSSTSMGMVPHFTLLAWPIDESISFDRRPGAGAGTTGQARGLALLGGGGFKAVEANLRDDARPVAPDPGGEFHGDRH